MSIAWITAEVTPYVKVGGLADVSSALPKAISQLGHDIRIIVPFHGTIEEDDSFKKRKEEFVDPEGKLCEIFETNHRENGVTMYLLKHQSFGNAAYDEQDDLGEKFATFNWLVSRLFDQIQWHPDIVHVNDWHTGLLPYILRHKPTKIIYTLHNLAFQGIESSQHLERLEIDTSELGEIEEQINFMRIGINFSDKVTTVSETYANEIQTPEFGFGLEEDLINAKNGVTGIVHGIDTDEYDPVKDPLITKNYSKNSLHDKVENKLALQEKSGFPRNEELFLIGLVSRLYDQKGIHHLIEIIPHLVEQNIQVIVLGTGDDDYERELQRLEYSFPEFVKFYNLYNVKLSHQIFASVDAFIVPSKFEPCGLTQLYSMAYGTVPIVRNTGGLADTVQEHGDEANGFVFDTFSGKDLQQAIIRGKNVFIHEPDKWKKLQLNGMEKDLSWKNPATKWIDLYNELRR